MTVSELHGARRANERVCRRDECHPAAREGAIRGLAIVMENTTSPPPKVQLQNTLITPPGGWRSESKLLRFAAVTSQKAPYLPRSLLFSWLLVRLRVVSLVVQNTSGHAFDFFPCDFLGMFHRLGGYRYNSRIRFLLFSHFVTPCLAAIKHIRGDCTPKRKAHATTTSLLPLIEMARKQLRMGKSIVELMA